MRTEGARRLHRGDDVRADTAVFDSRGLRLDEVTSAVRGVESMLVLDTCYAGTGRGGEPILDGSRFAVPAAALAPPVEVAVWSAAAPSELSGAVDEAGHGAFTYFVLGALRGWADGELTGQRDGRIDLDEAQAFVRRAMAAHQLTGQHAQLEGRLDALTWAGEVGPEWTRIPVQAPPAASELPDSPAPMAAGPSEPPPAASAPSAAALPRAPRKSRGPKLQSAGWIIAGSGAVLGLGTAIGARAIEAPSNGQVQALTALNVLGWSAAGLGGGLFLVGSLPARDQAASLAIGGRF